MSLRTVLIVLVCVLLGTSILAAGADDEDQAVKPPDRPATTGPSEGTRQITLSDKQVARAKVGELLELTVEADSVDSIEAFGQVQGVDPDAPAVFTVILDEAGTFPVRLVSTGAAVGGVRVVEPDEPVADEAKPRTVPEPAVSGGTSGPEA